MTLKVMLVTDDTVMITKMRAACLQADMDVTAAQNINESIDLAARFKYDAIVLDAGMPECHKMLQTIRVEQPDVVVVAFSRNNELRRQMLKHGARAYFTTHHSPCELAIEQLIIERIELCAGCGECPRPQGSN